MNNTTRVLMLSLMSVAVLAGCKKDVKPTPPADTTTTTPTTPTAPTWHCWPLRGGCKWVKTQRPNLLFDWLKSGVPANSALARC